MYISSVKIKIILAKQQMSLRQFCKINNLAYSTVIGLMNKERIGNLRTVEKIAQALGVNLWNIGGEIIMENKSAYVNAHEVSQLLGVSQSKAYQIIKKMNDDLREDGYLTIAGKVSRAYFNEKWYGASNEWIKK